MRLKSLKNLLQLTSPRLKWTEDRQQIQTLQEDLWAQTLQLASVVLVVSAGWPRQLFSAGTPVEGL